MGKAEPTDATLKQFRTGFPASLVGSWSTFGDDYGMEYGQTATFHADGSDVFEMWDSTDEEEPERTSPFLWMVKRGFEVEVKPRSSEKLCPEDWGSFVVDFFISQDAYGNKSVSIRDAQASDGREGFWWFLEPERHPMRLLKSSKLEA